MKTQKIIFTKNNLVFIVWYGKSSNEKVSNGRALVQTFTFSMDQWKFAHSGEKGMHNFFSLDGSNCMDCPFSRNNGGAGGCYTHKMMQYSGFLSMLRSIKADQLTPLNGDKIDQILVMARDRYVRFGSYGEPSLMPVHLVELMAKMSRSWTGYTHQHAKQWAQKFAPFFMASTHKANEAKEWRAFEVVKESEKSNSVVCPASKEGGNKTSCAACGLCSGLKGKGKKNVVIIEH